ncbi:MAG: helix-turn-helix domain-containing protein [Lachnospiraceae bacterium]|nr:helix-turn-helix domain-containing protein [Lachnospiraceae bacterium]
MYEIFEQLLALKGVTAYQVAKETGIATATLSDWKRGRSTPKQDKLQKIADYFHVSLTYLLTGKENSSSENNEANLLFQTIMNRENLKVLLEYALRAEDSDLLIVIEMLKALEKKGKSH